MSDAEDGSFYDEPWPEVPWCEDCWKPAGEGTRSERDGLPDECGRCGSTEVFWI